MITKKVRLSYLNAFEPKAAPGSTALKYSACVLISKDDAETLKRVDEAVQKAIAVGISKGKFTAAQVKMLKMPLRDGDDEYDGESRGKEYQGCMFLNASNKNAPGIVGPDAKTPIFDPNELYSGCYAYADINFFPFNAQGNKGVGVGLNNLMKVADGDRLDGRQDAESAFDGLGGEVNESTDVGDLE